MVPVLVSWNLHVKQLHFLDLLYSHTLATLILSEVIEERQADVPEELRVVRVLNIPNKESLDQEPARFGNWTVFLPYLLNDIINNSFFFATNFTTQMRTWKSGHKCHKQGKLNAVLSRYPAKSTNFIYEVIKGKFPLSVVTRTMYQNVGNRQHSTMDRPTDNFPIDRGFLFPL